MGKPEGYVENYLVKRCKEVGFLCYKFTSPGHSGVPDRIVIGNGHTVFVELKAKNGHPSALQVKTISDIKNVGGDARIFYTREQVDAFIDEALSWHDNPMINLDALATDIMIRFLTTMEDYAETDNRIEIEVAKSELCDIAKAALEDNKRGDRHEIEE